jgi:hypothetical protein
LHKAIRPVSRSRVSLPFSSSSHGPLRPSQHHGSGRDQGRPLADPDFGEVENLQVSVKGPADFVSNADKQAEKIVFEELQKARPTYSFLMEEGGEVTGTDGQHRWIIDPLDGTTNFLHGVPLFAVAIALERAGEIVASVIYNPIMDELFTAEKGGGAWLNDRKRLRVANRKHLSEALVVTGVNSQGRSLDVLQLRSWARSFPPSPASAAPARPRPISPGSPPGASTPTGKPASSPGTSRPAGCCCAKPAAR